MNKKEQIEQLKNEAENLSHRNIKQKNELMLKIKEHLSKGKYKKEINEKFNTINFEYVEFYKGFHSPKSIDDSWNKGKRDLLIFLGTLE